MYCISLDSEIMATLTNLFWFFLLHFVIAPFQINLDLIDWISDSQSHVIFEHDCLHVAASIEKGIGVHEIISYCLTKLPSKWNIQENNFNQKFTFDELFKQNITSQQLYIWPAPMDLIERYQLYLINYKFLNNT